VSCDWFLDFRRGVPYGDAMPSWRLLSNHARVLVFIGRQPKARLRDIAEAVDLTERSVHRIVSELCEDGYLKRLPNGRTNHYEIQPETPIHDPLLGDHWVGEILAVVAGTTAWPAQEHAQKGKARSTTGKAE
jgi:MarR family protein